ncbi:hypothetical protein [Dulcicalothrix desertica]|uniref:hypothetical protein n=1 Tax=Dulcicalothrix desertica TaxID=32056 RepID=UPI000F8F1F2A|nr:hypothetical protein [Dulcicalothrix desertica]
MKYTYHNTSTDKEIKTLTGHTTDVNGVTSYLLARLFSISTYNNILDSLSKYQLLVNSEGR